MRTMSVPRMRSIPTGYCQTWRRATLECALMGRQGRLSRLEATEFSEIAFPQDDHSCFEEPVY